MRVFNQIASKSESVVNSCFLWVCDFLAICLECDPRHEEWRGEAQYFAPGQGFMLENTDS